MIHPAAIIHPQAQLGARVRVAPYALIDAGVTLGDDCVVGPYVYLTGNTQIGAGNHFHAGCVIGDAPQDLKYKDEPARLRIGDRNVFREHFTVHRANQLAGETVIGSDGFFMAGSHVAHNCRIGDHVILANGALLAGHVEVQDRAFISGNCLVHQFCRVGTLAIMQGGSAISKDLPPFTVARGGNGICGLNTVGLRRAGFDAAARLELKKLYLLLFRHRSNLAALLAQARQEFTSAAAQTLIEFVATARRGICVNARSGGYSSDEP